MKSNATGAKLKKINKRIGIGFALRSRRDAAGGLRLGMCTVQQPAKGLCFGSKC